MLRQHQNIQQAREGNHVTLSGEYTVTHGARTYCVPAVAASTNGKADPSDTFTANWDNLPSQALGHRQQQADQQHSPHK